MKLKNITRTIKTLTVQASVVGFKDGVLTEVKLPERTFEAGVKDKLIRESYQAEVFEQSLRNAFYSTGVLTLKEQKTDEKIYSISVEDFVKYATSPTATADAITEIAGETATA